MDFLGENEAQRMAMSRAYMNQLDTMVSGGAMSNPLYMAMAGGSGAQQQQDPNAGSTYNFTMPASTYNFPAAQIPQAQINFLATPQMPQMPQQPQQPQATTPTPTQSEAPKPTQSTVAQQGGGFTFQSPTGGAQTLKPGVPGGSGGTFQNTGQNAIELAQQGTQYGGVGTGYSSFGGY